MRLRSGVNIELEEMANEILKQSREGVTKHSEKNDWLTDSQLDRRRSREILNVNGVPDSELVSGMTRRVYVHPRDKGPRDLRMSEDE